MQLLTARLEQPGRHTCTQPSCPQPTHAHAGYDRKKYVWKLLYVYMLGFDVEFGHKQACDLIPAQKWVGRALQPPHSPGSPAPVNTRMPLPSAACAAWHMPSWELPIPSGGVGWDGPVRPPPPPRRLWASAAAQPPPPPAARSTPAAASRRGSTC